MPFKSEAQRRKFAELVAQGKMSQETFDEWNRHTPKGRLPERIRPKKQKFSQPNPQRKPHGKK